VLRRGVSRDGLLDSWGDRSATASTCRCWMLPQAAAERAQVSRPAALAGGSAGGQLLTPRPAPCPWWTNCPNPANGLGAEPFGTGALAAETIRWGGATLPLLAPSASCHATCLTATKRPLTSKPLFLWPTGSGDRVRSPTPLGALRLRTPAWHFLQSEPCRRRNACWPRPLKTHRLQPTAHRPGLEPGGLPHGRVVDRGAARPRAGRCGPSAAASVASFGPGASLPLALAAGPGAPGVPLRNRPSSIAALRTAQSAGSSAILLPHSSRGWSLELASCPARWGRPLLLQYYQGTEGLCGWKGLKRSGKIAPGRTTATNGTWRYLDCPLRRARSCWS